MCAEILSSSFNYLKWDSENSEGLMVSFHCWGPGLILMRNPAPRGPPPPKKKVGVHNKVPSEVSRLVIEVLRLVLKRKVDLARAEWWDHGSVAAALGGCSLLLLFDWQEEYARASVSASWGVGKAGESREGAPPRSGTGEGPVRGTQRSRPDFQG